MISPTVAYTLTASTARASRSIVGLGGDGARPRRGHAPTASPSRSDFTVASRLSCASSTSGPIRRISGGASSLPSSTTLTPTTRWRPSLSLRSRSYAASAISRWNQPCSIPTRTPSSIEPPPSSARWANTSSAAALELVGERLDVPRAAERVGDVARRASRARSPAGSAARGGPPSPTAARASRPSSWCAGSGCRPAPRPAPRSRCGRG